ncbi:MAG: hypothetical protein WA919_21890 [Coleofasciculaceae cyanobacterium]
MATDYILFIHGVNTREKREKPTYADQLFGLIQERVSSSVQLKKVSLYWGDVNREAEEQLLESFRSDSKKWRKFWFKDFREQQILQFVGDAALYLSSHIGSKVVETLTNQTLKSLEGFKPGDRLHLVTHSWGTVIFFDVLFASRWYNPEIPGHKSVQELHKAFHGIDPEPDQGICFSSIHTMGSPIALFSLISLSGQSSRDFAPNLKKLLDMLYQARNGKELPWLNFSHPGDPVAWPLANLIPSLLDECQDYVAVEDILTSNADVSDFLTQPLSQTILALVHGGDAHGSYWSSKEVADKIAQTINQETPH